MARGIPRPSILEVPDLFSLLDSPRNRFYHSSDPRGPRQNSSRTSKIDYPSFHNFFLYSLEENKIVDTPILKLAMVKRFKVFILLKCTKYPRYTPDRPQADI